jgi:hypothetical protein
VNASPRSIELRVPRPPRSDIPRGHFRVCLGQAFPPRCQHPEPCGAASTRWQPGWPCPVRSARG